MEAGKRSHAIVCTYVYKDSIKRVYDCYRLPEVFHQVLKHADTIKLVKGAHYGEVGTEVELGWKNVFCVHFKVIEVVDEENYKQIKFYTTKVEPFNLKYTLAFHFHWNSTEQKTLFVHEMTFDDPEALKTIDINHDRNEKIEIFKSIEKILFTRLDDLYQYESSIIKCNIDHLWSVITDWRKFQTLVPLIGDSVIYEGDNCNTADLGSKVHVLDSDKKMDYYLTVIQSESDDLSKKKFVMECAESKPPSPLQHLEFVLIKIDEDQTFFEFKHTFKEPVKFVLLKNIKKYKIEVMNKLRKI